MAESFFATLKNELIYRHVWPTRRHAQLAIFNSSPAGTTNTAFIPPWATPAPPKSSGALYLLPSRPNQPLHRSGSRPVWSSPACVDR